VYFVLFLDCLYICICECLFQNNNKKIKYQNKTNCGSAFEPGLPYYWASICVRFGCIPRSSCVPGFKTRTPKKKPCYCAPPVCVPDVIGGLVVWWHNKTTLKNKKWGWHQVSRHMHGIINVRSTSFHATDHSFPVFSTNSSESLPSHCNHNILVLQLDDSWTALCQNQDRKGGLLKTEMLRFFGPGQVLGS